MEKGLAGKPGDRKKQLLIVAVALLAAVLATGYWYFYVAPGTVVGNKPFLKTVKSLPECVFGNSFSGGSAADAVHVPCRIPRDAVYF
jgi:hypothetical protein